VGQKVRQEADQDRHQAVDHPRDHPALQVVQDQPVLQALHLQQRQSLEVHHRSSHGLVISQKYPSHARSHGCYIYQSSFKCSVVSLIMYFCSVKKRILVLLIAQFTSIVVLEESHIGPRGPIYKSLSLGDKVLENFQGLCILQTVHYVHKFCYRHRA